MHEPTPEEKKFIKALNRLAKTMPKTMELVTCGDDSVNAIRRDSSGNIATRVAVDSFGGMAVDPSGRIDVDIDLKVSAADYF